MPKHSSRTTGRRAKAKSKGPQIPGVQRVLRSGAFTVFAVFAIIIISISVTKEVIRKIEIGRQISMLEEEITSLENQNADLGDLVQYFNSSSFQEKEARSKLGLKEDGETVVIVPQEITTDADASIAEGGPESTTQSNFTKWKNYFFN